MANVQKIEENYRTARDLYSEWEVDTDSVIERLNNIYLSLNCWQGDDVLGFEGADELTGGLEVTGNYPGRARTPQELRGDLDKAMSLIPGRHKVNLHAMYAETGNSKIDRDGLTREHYTNWVEWARESNIALDFNPTFFNHPKSNDGFTLSHADEGIRNFWIRHAKAARRIGEFFGKELGTPCITNIWIPDGFKDEPVDRYTPRQRLKESLDEILKEDISPRYNLDSVESKLFGIGSESYVVGSHDFYLGYAVENNILLCMDDGHYHPQECISDKITAVLNFIDSLLLHMTRGVRWDSDHVVSFNDRTRAIMSEIARNNLFDRVHLALDFFDATINRIAAWVAGARNAKKALLTAMLEPAEMLRMMEVKKDYTSRFVVLEELKSFPFGAVWDYYCLRNNVPVRAHWLRDIQDYEKRILKSRTV